MNLQQLFRILRARWLLMLVTMVIVVGLTVFVSLIIPPRYTATASVVIDMKGIDPVTGTVLPIVIPAAGYLSTQVDIISSPKVARKVVDMLRLSESQAARDLWMSKTDGKGNVRDFLADLLLDDLKVQPSRDSSVVNVSYRSGDPRFAAAVANAFVQGYISSNLEFRIEPARQSSAFFNEQVKTLKDKLEQAQTKLSSFQREKGIIGTDERLDVETGRLNELSSQLVAAQAQTYDSQTRLRQVQDILARGEIPDTLPDVLANPVIQGLKANLTQLDAKLNDLAGRVGKNHPQYQSVQAEIAGVKKKLDEEMRTIGRTLGNSASLAQKREDQIRASLAAQRSKVLELKQTRDDMTLLMREVENAQRSYDGVSQRLNLTRLESQTTQTNVMLVNEAVEPIEPSFPKLFLNTALAIILGGMIAVGLALLREMFDRILRSEDDIDAALGLPLLGVVAKTPRLRLRRWRRNEVLGGGA